MSYEDTIDVDAAFRRYEALRPGLPVASFPSAPRPCGGLIEIADGFDAFILDGFGVLNVGETAIAGAVDALATLRAMGKRLIVLTNAASYPAQAAWTRYRRMGFDFSPVEIVSSRDVCQGRLDDVLAGGRWGAIAAAGDRFEDISAEVVPWPGAADDDVDGFLFLSSAALNARLLQVLEEALRARPRPLAVANPDLVAPREGGLSKEPGFYAAHIAERLGLAPAYFGKPFPDAFEDALAGLPGIDRNRIAMVGDTLHTDILGGRAAGLRTVLVSDHGLFSGRPIDDYLLRSGVVPDFVCPSI
jgi:HAD superfamily hydrolase (TIGR01459 family)